MVYHTGPKIVTDGLVLCLDAADRKSYPGTGTAWNDLSGNGYNGAITAATFDAGNNGSIVFDGSDDYVTTNFNITGGINISFNCWVKFNNLSTGQVIADNSTGSTGFSLRVGTDGTGDGKYSPFAYGGGQVLILNSSITLATNVWYNIVTVYTTNRIDSYINLFNEYATGSMSSIVQDTVNNMRIGVRSDATDYDLNARLAVFSVYNKALSADEVRRNYNATKGRFGL